MTRYEQTEHPQLAWADEAALWRARARERLDASVRIDAHTRGVLSLFIAEPGPTSGYESPSDPKVAKRAARAFYALISHVDGASVSEVAAELRVGCEMTRKLFGVARKRIRFVYQYRATRAYGEERKAIFNEFVALWPRLQRRGRPRKSV